MLSIRMILNCFSIGGLKSTNDLQQVLDEITKMDPSFDLESFIRYCRFIVIPNVLEVCTVHLKWIVLKYDILVIIISSDHY